MKLKMLTFLIASIFTMLTIDGTLNNNLTANELSQKRIAQIAKLEKDIEYLDAQISHYINLKAIAKRNRMHSEGLYDSKINRLRSKREILVLKWKELYRIEQEYQIKQEKEGEASKGKKFNFWPWK